MVFDENFNGRVFVPSNIRDNKQAIIGQLDIRDLLFITIAGGIFAIIFFTLKNFVGNNIALVVSLLFALPILIAGFVKVDGLRIEEYIVVIRANRLLSSKVRINNSDNIYEILEKDKKVKAQSKNTNKDKKKKKKRLNF